MINRIRIKNFKSIRDVTVDLSPVTVLIGKSGAGKSAFVESIRFLRDVLSEKDHNAWINSWYCTRPSMAADRFVTDFEIDFSILGTIRFALSKWTDLKPESVPSPQNKRKPLTKDSWNPGNY